MRVFLALITLNGLNLVLWSLVGGCRLFYEGAGRLGRRLRAGRLARRLRLGASKNARGAAPERLTPSDVAVLVCAHNEQQTIHLCLDAVSRLVPKCNIFVGSDGSTDDTVQIARERGCHVLDIQPNGGKARALDALIRHFAIHEHFAAALILDADAQIDEHYLEHALPLFDDPAVVAVAGHAIPGWSSSWRHAWSNFFIAYRIRLYRITQALLRYGQTWKYSNVNFIVPGFASMYRCSALRNIDIAVPGLIIEDFNMTFELQHKKLGKIAYTPKVRSISHEPHGFRDYCRQVRRWYLGFWQTVRRHGFWPSLFWLSLGTYVVEMLLQSIAFLTLPFLLAWFVVTAGESIAIWLPPLGVVDLSLVDVALGVFVADYALTTLICTLERKPVMMLYGLGFVLLRWIDAFLFLYTLPLSFFEKSDGRWASPTRI
jgi:biofilm PGA synthesis N-glycosyltransferase PgaC